MVYGYEASVVLRCDIGSGVEKGLDYANTMLTGRKVQGSGAVKRGLRVYVRARRYARPLLFEPLPQRKTWWCSNLRT